MKTVIRTYRDLIVWQEAMKLIRLGYALARMYPKFETYGLAQQLRRAVVSVAANIAEGHGRAHRKEYCYHLSVAYGSLMEAETEGLVGHQEGYCSETELEPFMKQAASVGQLLNALMRSLRRSQAPDPRPQIPQ